MTYEERALNRMMKGNAATLVTLAVQTITVVWGASGLFTRVDILTQQVIELRGDLKSLQDKAYYITDAARDFAQMRESHKDLAVRVDKVEERIRENEKIISLRRP